MITPLNASTVHFITALYVRATALDEQLSRVNNRMTQGKPALKSPIVNSASENAHTNLTSISV